MGIELVKLAVARGGHLDKNPYKVLVAMCVQALDRSNGHHPADTYWAGWEVLALALGLDPDPPHDPVNDPDGTLRERRVKRAQETVRRAIQVLAKQGYIVPTRLARAGTRQRWVVDRAALTEGQTLIEPPRKTGAEPPRGRGAEPPRETGFSPHAKRGRRTEEEEDRTNNRTERSTSQPKNRGRPKAVDNRPDAGRNHQHDEARDPWSTPDPKAPHDYADDGSGLSCSICGTPEANPRHNAWNQWNTA